MKIKITRVVALSFTVATMFGLTGCAGYNAMQGFPDQSYNVSGQIKKLTASVDASNTKLDSITTMAARNQYIDQRINLIDLEYVKYLKYVSGVKNGFDASKEIAVGTMGAVSALVGGGTAQVLGAATAATTAANGGINTTYFYNQALPAILSAMDAGRKAVDARIAERRLNSIDDAANSYSIYNAASDLNDYYFAGTLPGAALYIQNNSSKQAAAAVQAKDLAPSAKSATAAIQSGTNFNDLNVLQKKALLLKQNDLNMLQ